MPLACLLALGRAQSPFYCPGSDVRPLQARGGARSAKSSRLGTEAGAVTLQVALQPAGKASQLIWAARASFGAKPPQASTSYALHVTDPEDACTPLSTPVDLAGTLQPRSCVTHRP